MDMRAKYRCGQCNYQFFMARQPSICPYCAKPGVMMEDEFFSVQREIENA